MKTLNIFKDERFRFYLADDTNGFGEYVAGVVARFVFAAQRKRLTRRTVCKQFNSPVKVTVIYRANVGLNDASIFYRSITVLNVEV